MSYLIDFKKITLEQYKKELEKRTFIPSCVFRRHPDNDTGIIRTAYRNYPDTLSS